MASSKPTSTPAAGGTCTCRSRQGWSAMLLDVPPEPGVGRPGCTRCSPRDRPVTWARALALAELYAGLFRVVPCAAGPGYHLALDCGDGVNRDSAGIGLPGVPGGDGGGSEAEIGERAWRGEFVCCADVRLASCCNPGTALTVGELRAAWTGVDDATPILVARNGRQADWAQAADVIAAEEPVDAEPTGLVVVTRDGDRWRAEIADLAVAYQPAAPLVRVDGRVRGVLGLRRVDWVNYQFHI